jgi:hypothetical protein
LYAVVEPCERKSVTAQEFAVTSVVPLSLADVIVPVVVVVYVNVVGVGTVVIVYVPFNGALVDPETVTSSPIRYV